MSSIVIQPGSGGQRGGQRDGQRGGTRYGAEPSADYQAFDTHYGDRVAHGPRTSRPVSGADRLNRMLGLIIVGLSLILIFELAFHAWIAPKMVLSDIRVSVPSASDLPRGEVLRVAGVDETLYYFSVDEAEIIRNLESYPLFKSARVTKVFPRTLDIAVELRSPLALALVPVGDLMVPVTVDENGVIFEMGAGVTDIDLPVISGLKFADLELGMRLPEELAEYLRQLKMLKEQEPVLFDLISECKFVKKNRSDYEVLLFPSSYPVRIRTGASIDARLVRYVMMVLDVVAKQGIMNSVEEIDFRTNDRGSVVYRMREG